MAQPGAAQQRLAGVLTGAFAEGLLSQRTLTHRLRLLFGAPAVDPALVVGDLVRRPARRGPAVEALAGAGDALRRTALELRRPFRDETSSMLLPLDWTGARDELIIGRDQDCDVVLGDRSVSRIHAALSFRRNGWVIEDLDSTNGTVVNGVRVGRCRLFPGDRLVVGGQAILID